MLDLKTAIYTIAKRNGYYVNEENKESILKAKERFKLGVKCPCCPDIQEMYCGSKFCSNEVLVKGRCHCGLFKKES